MTLPSIAIGSLSVSRFIIGGNPFSGFSHQSKKRTDEMLAWYTDERIVETLFEAERLGVTACIERGDPHIARCLRSYWDQGGKMIWLGQTDSRQPTQVDAARFCIDHGASACFLHGGVADYCVANGEYGRIEAFVDAVRDAGLPVGTAGHVPEDFRWSEQNLDLDFYMVCYYNPSNRDRVPHHDPEASERYDEGDRAERVATIAALTKPVIHYKILAAGRLAPKDAFTFAAQHMRPSDAVCVGIYTQDNPNMIAEDVDLLLRSLSAVGQ